MKRFFVLTPDDQQFFDTLEEAHEYANSWISEYRNPYEWGCDEGDITIHHVTHYNAITNENEKGHDYEMVALS